MRGWFTGTIILIVRRWGLRAEPRVSKQAIEQNEIGVNAFGMQDYPRSFSGGICALGCAVQYNRELCWLGNENGECELA